MLLLLLLLLGEKKLEKKKSSYITLVAVLCIFIMAGSTFVSTASSSIIPIIDQFTAEKTVVDVGEEVTFSVMLSQFGGPAQYFLFLFHDGMGNISTSGSMTHSFMHEGVYLVSVEARGPNNITDVKTIEITVQ
ncbi:MAG: PKD domain-containing protein, partial [Candidatus Helarchaeota archaeon]